MRRTIRTLTLPEIRTLLDWAAAEGWNPGLDDAPAFQAADPAGFFGALVDGQMVAGIAAVAYDAAFGFIGLYICHPGWRGQGHGKAIWEAAIAYLGNRTIGLDGVTEQLSNYASMGFVPQYETVRMSGNLPAAAGGEHIVRVDSLDLIRALDRQCFPAARDDFLRHWLAPPREGLMHRVDGAIDGYAVCRSCQEGAKIGPLLAHTTETAVALLTAQSGFIHLDVPADQTAWLSALSDFGFVAGFRTQRMYRGEPPAVDRSIVFAVSSLELG